jgi:hypothetical protein
LLTHLTKLQGSSLQAKHGFGLLMACLILACHSLSQVRDDDGGGGMDDEMGT